MAKLVLRVSTGEREASRRSTGLMTWCFTAAMSASVRSPSRMYTVAVRTSGRSTCSSSWMHWAAESARWSNCPGRYSAAKTAPVYSGSSRVTVSTIGSENTLGTAFSNRSASRFSTS